jgi:hypothetical protein
MIPLKKREPVTYNRPKPEGYKTNVELIMECRRGIQSEYGLSFFRGLASELASRLAEADAKVSLLETLVFQGQ